MCSRDSSNGDRTTNDSLALSRVSILVGFICASSYFGAFVGTGWVYIKEPYKLTYLNLYTSVTFKIGLWRTCYSFKRINSTITPDIHNCTFISFTNWSQVGIPQIDTITDIELTVGIVHKIRWCTLFFSCASVLLLNAFICSVVGHFYEDNKTLLASAIYMLSGLCSAAGLFVFVCIIIDSYMIYTRDIFWSEVTDEYDINMTNIRGLRGYKYGWCFMVASICCIFVEIVAVLCIMVHHKRYHTIAYIIKDINPVGEKLTNKHYVSTTDSIKYNSSETNDKTHPIDSETPPDICSTFLNDSEYITTANTNTRSSLKKMGNYATINKRNHLYNHSTNLSQNYLAINECNPLHCNTTVNTRPNSSFSSLSTDFPSIDKSKSHQCGSDDSTPKNTISVRSIAAMNSTLGRFEIWNDSFGL